MSTLVLFHGNCIDGFTAAWAVWKKYGHEGVEYAAMNFGEPAPDVQGKDVVIVDFSFPRNVLVGMNNECKSLLVLDHHKTAKEDLAGLDFAVFDLERSGAGMAWDWFHGKESRPWLIDYVEDRDLWRFKLPTSKLVNSWVAAQRREHFEDWDRLSSEDLANAALKGQCVETYIDRYVHEMQAQARFVVFEGVNVPCVNAPYIQISELVGELAKGVPFAMGWFQRGDGMYQYSLRSRGDVDVSAIAKKYGGGGHPQSAGFQLAKPLDLVALVTR